MHQAALLGENLKDSSKFGWKTAESSKLIIKDIIYFLKILIFYSWTWLASNERCHTKSYRLVKLELPSTTKR